MTLGISIVCSDGVILASDSQSTVITAALKRLGETKIRRINPMTYVVTAGTVSYAERVLEKLDSLKGREIRDNQTAGNIKEILSQVVVTITAEFRNRYREATMDPNESPDAVFILVSYNKRPEAYLVDHVGNFHKIDKYETIGSSSAYAEVILMNHYRNDLSVEQGKKLAHWTISQCKDLDPYVGGKITMKILKPDGVVESIKPTELKLMEDSYQIKKQTLSALFQKIDTFPEILDLLEDLEEIEKSNEEEYGKEYEEMIKRDEAEQLKKS